MPNLLIITTGTREVKTDFRKLQELYPKENLEIKEYNGSPSNLRKAGHCLMKALKEQKMNIEDIELPILQPLFDYVSKNNNFDKLWIVVTNQEDNIYRKSDTCEMAKVIAYLVVQNPNYKITNEDITFEEVNEFPQFFDTQYKKWGERLQNRSIELDSYANIYLCAQGGIDAINTALTLNLIKVCGDGKRLKTLQVGEDNMVTPTQIGSLIRNDEKKDLIKRLCDRYDYSALSEIKLSKEFKWLAEYGYARVQFNFEEAKLQMEKLSSSMEFRSFCIQARRELQDLSGTNALSQEALLREVVFNMDLCYQRGQYTDFLGRAFRVVEGIYSYYALKMLPGFEFKNESFKDDFQDYLKNDLELADFLQKRMIKAEQATTVLWQKICEKKYPKDATFFKLVQKLQPLKDRRNNSILAHGFNGVSKKDILNSFADKDEAKYEKNIKEILNVLGSEKNTQIQNPYDALNREILKMADAL